MTSQLHRVEAPPATAERPPVSADSRFAVAPFAVYLMGAFAVISLIALVIAQQMPAGTFVDSLTEAADLPAIAFATCAAFFAGSVAQGADRRMWRLLFAALLSWLIAESIWEIRHFVLGAGDDASIADLFYLMFYPLALAALFVRSRATDGSRVDLGFLDALIVVGAAGLALWEFGLDSTIADAESSTTTVINALYPAFDLGLLWMVVRPVCNRAWVWNSQRILFSLGLLGIFAADLAWMKLESGLYDVLATIALTLLGFAALAQPDEKQHPSTRDDRWRRIAEVVLLATGTMLAVALVTVRQLDESPVAVIGSAFVLILVLCRLLMTIAQNESLLRESEHRAGIDSLTGLFNHQIFQTRLDQEIARAEREKTPLALLLIDIDNFKNINDLTGHQVGDRILREIGARIATAARETDTVCRVGGDEIAVIAPGAAEIQSIDIASRVIRAVGEVRIPELGEGVNASVSIGCSVYPQLATNANELVETADSALYSVKQRGRNGCSVFDPGAAGPANAEQELQRVRAQLAASKSDFRAVFEHALDAMIISDDKGTVLSANAAALKLAGVSREKIVGKRILDFIRVEEKTTARSAINTTVEHGQHVGRIRAEMPDGSRPLLEFSTSRFSPNSYLSVIRDVTLSAQARADLAKSEAKFRAVFEHALDAMAIVDDSGVIVDANLAAVRLFGVSRPVLIGSLADGLATGWRVVGDPPRRVTVDGSVVEHGEFDLLDSGRGTRTYEFTRIGGVMPGKQMLIVRDGVADRDRTDTDMPSNGAVLTDSHGAARNRH